MCVHHADTRGGRILCRHFGEWLSPLRCDGCPAFVAGQSAPELVIEENLDQPEPSQCVHLGQIVANEPCSCGSETRIAIHACHCPARVRSFQEHAWCVPIALNWDRHADPMARTSFQCCETCEHRTDRPEI